MGAGGAAAAGATAMGSWAAGPGAAAAGAGAMGAAGPTGLLLVGEDSMAGGMEVRPARGEGTSSVEELIIAAICSKDRKGGVKQEERRREHWRGAICSKSGSAQPFLLFISSCYL